MTDVEIPAKTRVLFEPTSRQISRPRIRRARAACTACQVRKIRCTAQIDEPCSNCVFDNVQCIIAVKPPRPKKTRAHLSSQVAGRVAHKIGTSSSLSPDSGGNLNGSRHQTPNISSPATNSIQQSKPRSTCTEARPRLTSIDSELAEDAENEIDWKEAAFKNLSPPRILDPPWTPAFEDSTMNGTPASYQLPPFIAPPPPWLTDKDIHYLHQKGALSVPEPELRDALIEAYLLYVYPCYPVLDLEALDEALQGGSGHSFSLLVFQAVLFAGSCWVDIKLLRKLRFLTRLEARRAFYQKVRVSTRHLLLMVVFHSPL
jgi:hypothetical protein